MPNSMWGSKVLKTELRELEEIGFVRCNDYLLQYLRRHPELFPGLVRFTMGASPYQKEVLELFGTGYLSYCYRPENEGDLERHLERLFRMRNPSAGKKLTAAFTRRLHKKGLHWSGCGHKGLTNLDSEKMKKLVCLNCGEKTHNTTDCPLRGRKK